GFELDLFVAEYIGIGSASPLVLFQEVDENPLPILLFKIHCIIRNADLIANPPHIVEVLICCAETTLVSLVPILHKDAYDLVTRLLEHKCGHGGINPSGHSHRYTRHWKHLP